jgi:hypothetical protein
MLEEKHIAVCPSPLQMNVVSEPFGSWFFLPHVERLPTGPA